MVRELEGSRRTQLALQWGMVFGPAVVIDVLVGRLSHDAGAWSAPPRPIGVATFPPDASLEHCCVPVGFARQLGGSGLGG